MSTTLQEEIHWEHQPTNEWNTVHVLYRNGMEAGRIVDWGAPRIAAVLRESPTSPYYREISRHGTLEEAEAFLLQITGEGVVSESFEHSCQEVQRWKEELEKLPARPTPELLIRKRFGVWSLQNMATTYVRGIRFCPFCGIEL